MVKNLFIIIDNFPKSLLAIPSKNKNSQPITNDFSKILTKSKQRHLELE